MKTRDPFNLATGTTVVISYIYTYTYIDIDTNEGVYELYIHRTYKSLSFSLCTHENPLICLWIDTSCYRMLPLFSTSTGDDLCSPFIGSLLARDHNAKHRANEQAHPPMPWRQGGCHHLFEMSFFTTCYFWNLFFIGDEGVSSLSSFFFLYLNRNRLFSLSSSRFFCFFLFFFGLCLCSCLKSRPQSPITDTNQDNDEKIFTTC